eukprot:Sspe_Gene.22620::Locus_8627_Transcript_1_2_Confidence_0.500_Length_1270::g.22620::m.22620/K00789/metK; S-adenosylmethionine synthetase
MDKDTVFHLNPSGRFVIGGPQGDAGLTGRKIIRHVRWVGCARGWCLLREGPEQSRPVGVLRGAGGSRSRWWPLGWRSAALVQLAYAIGVAEAAVHPRRHLRDGEVHRRVHAKIVKENFRLRPYDIIKELNLRRPIYSETAAMGHFGRTSKDGFTWEIPRKLNLPAGLRSAS